MEIIRRISALLIALSLVLPQRSCENAGQLEIHYPLSNADSVLSMLVIAAFYTLPLAVLLLSRWRVPSLIVGALAVAAGLYYIAYGSSVFATRLLVGWYAYTLGACVYLVVSLELIRQALWPGRSHPVASADHLRG